MSPEQASVWDQCPGMNSSEVRGDQQLQIPVGLITRDAAYCGLKTRWFL